MPLPIQSAVQRTLTPYDARIRRAINQGFTAYVRRAGGGNLFPRTDAAEIFDCVVQAATAEFTEPTGVKVFQERGTARFLFGDVVVRFKKADRNGKGLNLRTRLNEAFLNPRLPFGDAPEAMKVEICWKLNALGTGYEDIVVTARDGARVLWSYSLPGGAQLVLPFMAPEAKPAVRKVVVKLKQKGVKSSEKGN
jgi:hypothetical protein